MLKRGKLLPPSSKIKYGIPTSIKATGNQWDYPYAWAPVQYFIYQGINHYTCKPVRADYASAIQAGWLNATDIYFAKTGIIIEKYVTNGPTHDQRVKRGYAQAQRGFGWTNAVYIWLYEN